MCLLLQEWAAPEHRRLGKTMSHFNFPVRAFHRLCNAVERMETGVRKAPHGIHSLSGMAHLAGLSVAKNEIHFWQNLSQY